MQIFHNLNAKLFVVVQPRCLGQAFRLLLVPINSACVQMTIGQRQPKLIEEKKVWDYRNHSREKPEVVMSSLNVSLYLSPELGWRTARQSCHHFHRMQPLIEIGHWILCRSTWGRSHRSRYRWCCRRRRRRCWHIVIDVWRNTGIADVIAVAVAVTAAVDLAIAISEWFWNWCFCWGRR